jgi:hypothetical protein
MNALRSSAPAAAASRIAFALLLAAVPACTDKEKPQQPATPPQEAELKPDDVLLVLDGITIAWKDVRERVEALDELAPEFSRKKKIQKVLSDYTIPVLFARRDFAEQRNAQRELATTLRNASGNVDELLKNANGRPFRRERISRGNVDLPVADFLFEPTNLGAVSPPIELPGGFVLAGCIDLTQTRVPMEDTCECVMVGFFTHDSQAEGQWELDLRTRLPQLVTYVHPDYRLAMPPWLNIP